MPAPHAENPTRERYTREEVLTDIFAERLRELVIAPEIVTWLQAELVASDRSEAAAREQSVRRLESELDRMQKRLDILYDDRLDGRIDGAKYDQKAGKITADQQQVRTCGCLSGRRLRNCGYRTPQVQRTKVI